MSAVWDLPDFDEHEGVHLICDPQSGLKAVIAIHSTQLGPAAGGVRFWHYADSGAAVTDALRLSRGMSFKNAMAGLPLGGGKGVVLAPERGTPAAFVAPLCAHGRDLWIDRADDRRSRDRGWRGPGLHRHRACAAPAGRVDLAPPQR